MADWSEYTDLQLIDLWCEKCMASINPAIFAEIRKRGLYNIINFLPNNTKEAKSVARARLVKAGKLHGDEEIDAIAQEVYRLEALKKQLMNLSVTDVHNTLPILEELIKRSTYVLNYYNDVKIP